MKEEDYVSYDVAKLLKEKGYNHYQKQHYFTEDINACKGAITIKGKTLTDMFSLSNDFNDKKLYAPSLWDAAKWLRENYGIFVNVKPEKDIAWDEDKEDYVEGPFWTYYVYSLKDIENAMSEWCKLSPYYEQTLNEGIKEALKMI